MFYFALKLLRVSNSFGRRGMETIWTETYNTFYYNDFGGNILRDLERTTVSQYIYRYCVLSVKNIDKFFYRSIEHSTTVWFKNENP
jgi:hypothetical protein